MPRLCPKCGSYDPTPEITSTSRCPACGVVYAKLSPDAGAADTVAEVNEPAAEDWALPDASPAAPAWRLWRCCSLPSH